MIKALFFDFDGTISDTKEIMHTSIKETFQRYNLNISSKFIKKHLGRPIPEILKKISFINTLANKFQKSFWRNVNKKIKNQKPCVSLKPLIELSSRYQIYIISNSNSKFVKKSVKYLGIGKIFKNIYGAENFETKDRLLKKISIRLGIKSVEAAYVGDRFSDIQCAQKAECVAVAIHNKCAWSSLKQIKKEKPDYIIRNFKELQKLLNNKNNKK